MLGVWFHTVFGFRSYHYLRQATPWRTAWFAIYLLAIGILVFNIYFAFQIHKQLPVFVKNFPSLTFDKGRLIAPDKAVSVVIPGTDYILRFDATAPHPPSVQNFINDKIIAFITGDRFYMISMGGLNSQPIPAQVDGVYDSQRLQSYVFTLRSLLSTMVFVGSFLITGTFLFFSMLMAAAVVFFWSRVSRKTQPFSTLTRWAVFLQGPAFVLWIIHLIWGVPLFSFAIFILFNIYVQQIFNTLPEKRGPNVA